MKQIISIVSLLFIVGFIHAQPRLSIKHQLQKCLDGSGNPIPNCMVFTDSLGRQFYATVEDGIDTLLLYGLRDTIIAYGGGGTAITVGPQDQIPFPNLGSTDFDYDADFLFQDSVLYVETTTNHPDQPALHVVRNMGDTAAFPLKTVLFENTTDIADATNEYQNELRLVLKAGGPTTGTSERYIEFDHEDGSVDHLFGVNGQGNKISYDPDNFQHREWYEEFGHTFLGSDNDQPFYINFVETFGVPMGPEPSEAPGTGGFIVGDGGVSPTRLFQVGVSDYDTELFKANGTDKWLIFDESSNAIQLFDGIINVNNFGSASHSLINFFRDDTQLAGSFFYNQSSQLRFFQGIGTGANADYHIFRYTGASSLQDLPLTIKNSNGQFNFGSYPIDGIANRPLAIESDDDVISPTWEQYADSIAQYLEILVEGSDSLVTCADSTLGFIVMGDTICVDVDSFWIIDPCVFGIDDGDTVMVCIPEGGVPGEHIFNTNLSMTNTPGEIRLGDLYNYEDSNHVTLSFRRDGELQFELNKPGLGAVIEMYNTDSSKPTLRMNNTQNTTFDIYTQVNSTSANEDYSYGLDDSEDAFVFSEGNLLTVNPWIKYFGGSDSLIILEGMKIDGILWDEDGDIGTIGDVLTKQADGTVNWEAGGGANGIYSALNNGSYWLSDTTYLNDTVIISGQDGEFDELSQFNVIVGGIGYPESFLKLEQYHIDIGISDGGGIYERMQFGDPYAQFTGDGIVFQSNQSNYAFADTGGSVNEPSNGTVNKLIGYDSTTGVWHNIRLNQIGGGTVSFGLDNQVPFTNSTTDDFDYDADFTFDGADLALGSTDLFVDGSDNRVGINDNTPDHVLDIHQAADTEDGLFIESNTTADELATLNLRGRQDGTDGNSSQLKFSNFDDDGGATSATATLAMIEVDRSVGDDEDGIMTFSTFKVNGTETEHIIADAITETTQVNGLKQSQVTTAASSLTASATQQVIHATTSGAFTLTMQDADITLGMTIRLFAPSASSVTITGGSGDTVVDFSGNRNRPLEIVAFGANLWTVQN